MTERVIPAELLQALLHVFQVLLAWLTVLFWRMALEAVEAVWLLPVVRRARRVRGVTLTLHPQTCGIACVLSFLVLC